MSDYSIIPSMLVMSEKGMGDANTVNSDYPFKSLNESQHLITIGGSRDE
jgi:hypothetical protein